MSSMTVSRGHLRVDLQLGDDFRLSMKRLDLVPAGQDLANTDWHDRDRLSKLLNATVPEQWPPDLVKDRNSPEGEGWWDWYIISREHNQRVLIGMAGLKGWPVVNNRVQLGCAFLPEFQKQGYGTESVAGLTTWALDQVSEVVAETPVDNYAAAAVLRRLGYRQVDSDDAALLRFAISAKSLADYRAH
jgi:[ribosomal protein S5]-alanine N-acetyltransferase